MHLLRLYYNVPDDFEGYGYHSVNVRVDEIAGADSHAADLYWNLGLVEPEVTVSCDHSRCEEVKAHITYCVNVSNASVGDNTYGPKPL